MQLHALEPLLKFSIHLYVKFFFLLTKISRGKLQTNINLYLKQESGEI